MQKEYPRVQPKTTLSWVLNALVTWYMGKMCQTKQKLIFLAVSLFPSLALENLDAFFV